MPEGSFPERLTRFLQAKLDTLREQYGESSHQYLGLARQYLKDDREETKSLESNIKHYEAEYSEREQLTGDRHSGMERLYRRSMVIEPTMACVAHCRYCLRSNYPRYTLTEHQLREIARLCGSPANQELREVLVTGGDPLLIPRRVDAFLEALIAEAPNVKTVRLATRIPTQDPERIDGDVLRLFQGKPMLRFELATQINHPTELTFPETISAFGRLRDCGVKAYSQNVLLKGINDDLSTLVELYDAMRQNDIEAHYLFHSIPMRGTHHLRTSLDKGIRLASELTSSGFISGRAKPMFAAMTDIGKVTLYERTVVDRQGGRVLLQTRYRPEDRLAWNPSWTIPQTALVDPEGYMRVWYLDGED